MLRILLIFFGLWLVSYNGQAASFDCVVTNHPVERAICENEQLSQLDKELTDLLSEQQKIVIEGDRYFPRIRNSWLEDMRERCSAVPLMMKCLQDEYEYRLSLFKTDYPFDSGYTEFTSSFDVVGAIAGYDIGLKFDSLVGCGKSEMCKTSSYLTIRKSRHKNAMQVIFLPFWDVTIDPIDSGERCALHGHGQLVRDSSGCTVRFEGQEFTKDLLADFLQIADYNFDGFPDIAIRVKNSYGFVFLYNKQDKKFYYAPSLSRLFDYNLVEVDAEKQELKTLSQSSYDHDESDYRVENNMPVLVRRFRQYREGDELIHEKSVWKGSYAQVVSQERTPLLD